MIATDGYKALRESAGTFPRGHRLVEVGGPGRQRLLNHLIARPTEYAQPGTVVESLVLDDDGRPVDLVLCVIDEPRVLLLSDRDGGALEDLDAVARRLGIDDVEIVARSGWAAVAIEGPESWRAVADVAGEDIAGVLFNEWREVEAPVTSTPAIFARTGGTAEYGYLVIAEADPVVLLEWLTGLAGAVGGGRSSSDAIDRARIEVNHPVLGSFDGLTVAEAGVAWMAGLGRDDEFRGKPSSAEPPQRRLVAATSSADLVQGTSVSADGRVVGRIQAVAPRAEQPTSIALVLLDLPFDVPGLTLDADGTELRTVSRPTVDPVSWVQGIE